MIDLALSELLETEINRTRSEGRFDWLCPQLNEPGGGFGPGGR